jgi:hypothetical protein
MSEPLLGKRYRVDSDDLSPSGKASQSPACVPHGIANQRGRDVDELTVVGRGWPASSARSPNATR